MQHLRAAPVTCLAIWLLLSFASANAASGGDVGYFARLFDAGVAANDWSGPQSENRKGAHQESRHAPSATEYSSPYAVEGLPLGARVRFGSVTYAEYKCEPSDRFPTFTWCEKYAQQRGEHSFQSILHAPDGATAYINRSMRPAFLDENDVKTEINRLSKQFGETARVLASPRKLGVPRGFIASWGRVELVKIDGDEMSLFQSGGSPDTGLFIDFLSDFEKSEKLDLPVYRLSGGAGYVWSASFDVRGIGHIRFLAVDASVFSGTAVASKEPPTPTPLPVPIPMPKDERRIALVIGNSEYRYVGKLDNPVNDAKLMAGALKELGFQLVGDGPLLDLDKPAFDSAVQNFGILLQGADVGLFYYAGHGMQVNNSNYLVPVNANTTRAEDVDFEMVNATLVLGQMEAAGTKLNVVMLDACRNNPFGGRGLRTVTGGLAQMQAPAGTIISYATQPGNVAQDGADGDSPYTKALAEIIRKPGLDVFQTFNQVGLEVKRVTEGAQQPWVSNSPIEGAFFFRPLVRVGLQ
jgi:hypothetical protein